MLLAHSLTRIFIFSFIFAISINTAVGQVWVGPHHRLDSEYFAGENSRPNLKTFSEMVGVTGGTNWDGLPDPNPVADFIQNARSFHLMEIDYRYVANPSNYEILACDNDCGDLTCFPPANVLLPTSSDEGSTLANNKFRYCTKWAPNFANVFASLESITPYYANGSHFDGNFVYRRFPDKWYNKEEWGNSPGVIRKNAKAYAKAFAATFCPVDTAKQCVVNVLEVGNEPWGIPGLTAYHNICRGVVAAMIEYYGSTTPADWRMKLSTAAFQADISHSSRNDYIDDMVPFDVRPYFDFVSIHPYSFEPDTRTLTEPPESTRGSFLRIKNMETWRRFKMPHASLNVTEFGWNSKTRTPEIPGVGEVAQSIYLIRAILLMSRYGIDKSFIYELIDQPPVDQYNSTGLLDENLRPKKAFFTLKKFLERYGTKRFLKAVTGGEDGSTVYAYLLGNEAGSPTHLVVWNGSNINDLQDYPRLFLAKKIELPRCLEIDENGDYTYLGWNETQDGPVADGQRIVNIKAAAKHKFTIYVSSVPLVIPLVNKGCKYSEGGELIHEDLSAYCADLESPGQIAGNEIACPSYDPEPIQSSRINGQPFRNVQYQWQRSTAGPGTEWEDIAGANDPDYDPPIIEQDHWFRRGIKKDGCPEYIYTEPVYKAVDANLCRQESPITIQCPPDMVRDAEENGLSTVSWDLPTATTECSVQIGDCSFPELTEEFHYLGRRANRQFYLSRSKYKWEDAWEFADALGGTLARIDRDEENEFITQALKEKDCLEAFIGISDVEQDQLFKWTDGSRPSYKNWSRNSVSFTGQLDCGYLAAWSDGAWFLASRWTAIPFVMSVPCNESTEATTIQLVQIDGPANNSQVGPGQHFVRYLAVDPCGNMTTCHFSLVVNETQEPNCQNELPDHLLHLGTHHGNRYFVSREKSSWEHGFQECQALGASLAIVTSRDENNWLVDQLKLHGVSTAFLGLSDRETDGWLRWVNGVNSGFVNWQVPIDPDNGHPDYTYLGSWGNGPWLLANGFTEKSFLCEMACVSENLELKRPLLRPYNQPTDIVIYPNPVRQQLNVKLSTEKLKRAYITNIDGKLLVDMELPKDDRSSFISADVSALHPGIYWLFISGPAGAEQVKRFVKM